MLRTGTVHNGSSYSALDLAKSILLCYENLYGLIDTSVSELSEIKGIGLAKAAQIVAAIELGRRAVSQKNGSNTSFKCSEDVANFYIPLLKDLKKEQFRIVLLNIKNRIIKEVMVSQVSLTSSIAHPRELLKIAIKSSVKNVNKSILVFYYFYYIILL